MAKLALFVDRHDTFGPEYMLHQIAQVWREQGHEVVITADLDPAIEADVAINHLDRTTLPLDLLSFFSRFPATINATALDISKQAISTNLVSKQDAYDGPVIVKTNANYGGLAEPAARGQGSILARAERAIRQRLPWSLRASITPSEYRIFETARDVPAPVWSNTDLVVERLITEKRDGLYCGRAWVFLGDKESNTLVFANDPIVKAQNILTFERRSNDEIPANLRQRRAELGFDFGKFDYVIVDGEAVLFDANRTPSLPGTPEEFQERATFFADGLTSLLKPT